MTITKLQKDELVKMLEVTIDPNMQHALVNILVQPMIKTWGDAFSFAAINRDRIKPVVLKVLMKMMKEQRNHMRDGKMPEHILGDVPAMDRIIEYAPILKGMRWPLILHT